MTGRASAAIVRHELRIVLSDPGTVVYMIVMPLLMAALLRGLYAEALQGEGVEGATGAEFAVPGMAVAFAAFSSGYAGFAFFRDHGWKTWDRLRASAASSADLVVGKLAPSVALTVIQMTVLFVLSVPLFGFEITGSPIALATLIVALALVLAAFGMAITAVAKTSQQLNALGSAGGFVMGVLGGAFVPVATMPDWAQAIAPFMPTYWAMQGLRSVVLESGGITDVMVPVLVMLGMGLLFAVFAAARFRFQDTKVYYG